MAKAGRTVEPRLRPTEDAAFQALGQGLDESEVGRILERVPGVWVAVLLVTGHVVRLSWAAAQAAGIVR